MPTCSPLSRREFVKSAALATSLAAFLPRTLAQPSPSNSPAVTPTPQPAASPLFSISLAQWSLHRALFAGTLDHLDFPKAAKRDYDIDAVEYVNAFFKEKAAPAYVGQLKKRCDDDGVTSLLIMCDGEGALGDVDDAKRAQAVDNHKKWVEAAKTLGCHSIRVNAQSRGSFEEQQKLAADGLRRLCEFADSHNINVIVENHGGLSSHALWLAAVIKRVDHKRAGTLPDFGNFRINDKETYDRYQGVHELMPFAKGVSAKSYAFDDQGRETTIDYARMLRVVTAAGYRGRIGIEYEGDKHPEPDGIRKTKALLEQIRLDIDAESRK